MDSTPEFIIAPDATGQFVRFNGVVARQGQAFGVRSVRPQATANVINTTSLSFWTISPTGAVSIQGGNKLQLDSQSSSQDQITSLLGLPTNAFTTALSAIYSGRIATNGAAALYTTTLSLSVPQVLSFNWTVTSGDMGSSNYLDSAWLVITNSTNGQDGLTLIASTMTPGSGSSRSGTYTRSFPAGQFRLSFACFNGQDTAVNITFVVSNVVFT